MPDTTIITIPHPSTPILIVKHETSVMFTTLTAIPKIEDQEGIAKRMRVDAVLTYENCD